MPLDTNHKAYNTSAYRGIDWTTYKLFQCHVCDVMFLYKRKYMTMNESRAKIAHKNALCTPVSSTSPKTTDITALRSRLKNAILCCNSNMKDYVNELKRLKQLISFCCHKDDVDANSDNNVKKFGRNHFSDMPDDQYILAVNLLEKQIEEQLSFLNM